MFPASPDGTVAPHVLHGMGGQVSGMIGWRTCVVSVVLVTAVVGAQPLHANDEPSARGRAGDDAAVVRADGGTSLHLPVRSFDGTLLDGWVHLPAMPAGARVPVVLAASPYWGGRAPAPADIENAKTAGFGKPSPQGMAFLDFVERGFAVALYNTRGSGNSEGCTDLLGPNERRDMKVLVEDLAGRTFSTGRVATIGKSYSGDTALAAAAEGAKGLRAVIASNPQQPDLYTVVFTPQGATLGTGPPNLMIYAGETASPPVDRSGRSTVATATRDYPRAAPGNVCPDVAAQLQATTLDLASDERDAQFWAARRMVEDLARSTVPVLVATGFRDMSVGNFRELELWPALQRGPRRLLFSQGGHTWPDGNPATGAFNDEVFAWLDHYLRGVGDEPATGGLVEYQDSGGRWHRDDAWPPRAARDEVLYLGGDALRAHRGGGDRRYVAAPDVVNHMATEEFLTTEPGQATVCPGSGDPAVSAAYTSAPVRERTVIAGNPVAHLRLSSDQPGGIVEVSLYKVPAGGCGAEGARFLGFGTADLRFHRDRYRGTDFPVATPTEVRVEVNAIAEALEPGERLLVVLSGGESIPNRPYTPNITVHADGAVPSHLVAPVVEGTFSGRAPKPHHSPRRHARDVRSDAAGR